ncbi:hypothetical protein EXIGLDRAFT_666383 [Exidia glandulosa HHB12029]|uniref:Sodium/calcium exchanger membrane region domain-containing protein n=1 Tax=Exidia glandulosa HHB12029 TaxID=1314781 RepID=A0A165NXZ0_EXIGL|nr:hypothetical protein EXIGLDRAFT_666383 [Exidia glandulosa HHB12029]
MEGETPGGTFQRFEIQEPHPDEGGAVVNAWYRFRGDYRKTPMPSIWSSMVGLHGNNLINGLFLVVPFAWAAHLTTNADGSHYFSASTRFSVNLVAIIPLQKRFEWLGEEMIPYIGAELGELLTITLSNTVEASLAIGLLVRDNYRLLQITIIGVVLLHILFVPGVTFFMGGARIVEQELHSGKTQINHTLLTFGVMAVVVPAAFFAALDRGRLQDLTQFVTHLNATATSLAERAVATLVRRAEEAGAGAEETTEQMRGHPELGPLLTDQRRGQFLQLSRGMAVLLLACYVGARYYMHNPPGKGNALSMYRRNVPSRLRERALKKEQRDSTLNPWFGVYAILQCVALMAVSAQFLVAAAEELLGNTGISEEWFGLILLPFVSFAGDAILSMLHWRRRYLHLPSWRKKPRRPRLEEEEEDSHEPDGVASGISIDLSIQFLLFWMPALVLIGWFSHKPFTLVFDLLEVALLVAACFLVNYVTADAKTNWAEGMTMIVFYVIIAIAAWFYPGQQELRIFVGRPSVAESLVHGAPEE